jgi:hypothetical protein
MALDHESGLPHIAHELFNLMAQIELYVAANPGIDFKSMLEFKQPPQDHKIVPPMLQAYVTNDGRIFHGPLPPDAVTDVPRRHCKPLFDAQPEAHYKAQDRASREHDAMSDTDWNNKGA